MLWTMDIMKKIHNSVPGSPYVVFGVGDNVDVISVKLRWRIDNQIIEQSASINRETLEDLYDMDDFIDNLIEHFTKVATMGADR